MPPVVDHAVHKMTQFDDGHRYGCHNRKDFADLYRAPQRFQTSDGYQAVFKYEAVVIPFTMSRTCRYDVASKTRGAVTVSTVAVVRLTMLKYAN